MVDKKLARAYLLIFFLIAIFFYIINLRLSHIEKLRCDVWRWEICAELAK